MLTNTTIEELEDIYGEAEEIEVESDWFDFDDQYDEGHGLYD